MKTVFFDIVSSPIYVAQFPFEICPFLSAAQIVTRTYHSSYQNEYDNNNYSRIWITEQLGDFNLYPLVHFKTYPYLIRHRDR